MLTNLLNALFGSRVPSDLARSTQGRWDDWLHPITDAAPTGKDLSDDDDFLVLKDEIAKVSNVDDTLIINTAERLLKHNAKDVRLAVYYIYGRMRRDGAEGVASGFELLSALVDSFGESLLPARAQIRRSSFEWLAGSTFADRLDRVQGLADILFERTLSALALITERTTNWPEAMRPDLDPLIRRLADRVDTPPAPDSGNHASSSNAAPPVTLPTATDLSSARELLDRARQMAQFLRQQPQGYLAAYRLMRCIRWDTLIEVPPHDVSGKTRLAAPRTELRAQLKRLLLQKQWQQVLERVEAAFAEGVNHLWLDLQFFAFTAQEHAGGEYSAVRDLAATDCALMLERLPGLDQLAFSDGSPFADDATLEWIARHATVCDMERGEAITPVSISSTDTDWAETQAQASDIAVQQGLDAALVWLQRLPSLDGERDRFLRQLVMARVAEHADRADTALHLVSTLDAAAQRFQLAAWEPSLAFEVKHHLLRLLKIRLTRKDVDKPALVHRIELLMGELTAIDPARAVTLA